MLKGIKLKSHPTAKQKEILSQWMGCARYIWNAKCRTDKEQRALLVPKGEWPIVDKTYSQYKSKEETPWIFDCPSVILRNSVSNWANTYQNFFKKQCGRPKHKKKDGRGSIQLTRELFQFKKGEDGVTRLFIGSKTNNIGYLSIKNHRNYKEPNAIYIKKKYNQYWVSFCYEKTQNPKPKALLTAKEHLKQLAKKDQKWLNTHVVGVDRGVIRPVQSSNQQEPYDLTTAEKTNKTYVEKRRLWYQKKLSRQKKGSNRRYKTKIRLAKQHANIANIRNNFCHQTSRKLVKDPSAKVFVFENLGTKRMTRRPKAKKDANGKYLPNKARAKAGLNRNILDKSWHLLEVYTKYKAHQAGKAFFKVAPNHTSQECAHCHHIHPNNRKSQSRFICGSCGHTDNADINAANVIKWRAIQLIRNSGTELSKRGVLSLGDIGRGASVGRKKPSATCATA